MDDFSDDGFDDLNDTTLQELENNAIQLTQAQKPLNTQLTQPAFAENDDFGLEDDDLDDAVVIDEAAQLPVRHTLDRQVHAQSLAAPSRSIQQQPRWQQPATGPKPSTQYQHARVVPPASNHHATPRPTIPQRMRPPPLPASNHLRSPATTTSSRVIPHDQDDQVAALEARVRALENDLNSARGEVAIVRSKHDKSVAAHDAEVSRLKKQNAEALAKQERMVEAAIHAEKAAATELHFTRQDLREELQKSKKLRTETAEAGVSTPRKNKANGRQAIADGFDDVEILPSPSKGQAGAKWKAKNTQLAPGERTPSRTKRKRPALESPVTALEVEDVAMVDADDSGAQQSFQSQPSRTAPFLRQDALPYDLLRLVLDHGAIHGQPLTFDLLSRYSFPSDPEQSFAGLIFQKLPSLGDPHDPTRLLIDFCDLMIDLWDQCLREEFYEPIFDLVSLISFVLQLNTISVAPYIASTLIPVAQTTIFLLAVPRFESQDGDLSATTNERLQHLALNIDTEGTLQLIYLVALGCIDSFLLDPANPLYLGPSRDPPQKLYWKLVQIDFVLVMLSPKQPRDEYLGMLSLLCTSCLADSIGPITGDPERNPVFVAQALIERVSKIMHVPLQWAAPGETSGAFGHKACVLRLAALRTLMAFAQSPLGAKQLALSDVAIPRLVNVLCGALDALYDMDVPVDDSQSEDENAEDRSGMPEAAEQSEAADKATDMQGVSTTDDTVANIDGDTKPTDVAPSVDDSQLEPNPTRLLFTLVSSAVLLLHTLVTDPATSAHTDMRAKLSTSHGASQKYLLTLSRLNYAEEDLVLEAGIDPGTFDRANDLLDLAITPDEAEGVREVFGTWS